jgi:hypothetical protein
MVKVEKPSAMDEIESITENCDGIMVARGDLGVETNPEDVPYSSENNGCCMSKVWTTLYCCNSNVREHD